MKRALLFILFVLVVLGAYLGAFPVRIEPQAWTAPPPFDLANSKCASPTGLGKVEILAPGLKGPEAMIIENGAVVTGALDGRVVRVALDKSGVFDVINTGGRPLGIKKMQDGRYAIADAHRGLIVVGPNGGMEQLSGVDPEGKPYKFADDLDIASDGTIYFTDASRRFAVEDWKMDILEHGRTGRLLAYRPSTKKVETLVDGLSFANGVALAGDESFVAFTELNEYVLKRLWLTGPKKGTVEVMTQLPGFPDNVTYAKQREIFWVAIGSPRDKIVDGTADKPWARKIIARLPAVLQPKPQPHAFVVGVDAQGQIAHCLQHVGDDAYAPVASVIEHEGSLYLGSFVRPGVGRTPAPQ